VGYSFVVLYQMHDEGAYGSVRAEAVLE